MAMNLKFIVCRNTIFCFNLKTDKQTNKQQTKKHKHTHTHTKGKKSNKQLKNITIITITIKAIITFFLSIIAIKGTSKSD